MLTFKTEKFEGPLALLLKLIEKEKMDITQISLAKITDQYVEYIKNSQNIKPDDVADFLVVAARLLLIKSRALLPYLEQEEEQEIEEFERQLKMYKEFLDASKNVERLIGKKKFSFSREFNRKIILDNVQIFSPPKKIKKQNLSDIFQNLVSNLEPEKKLEEKTIEHKINIEDKILSIQKMLINKIKISFNKLLNNTNSKTEVIVSFLAMLELIKQQDITACQEDMFKEIIIVKS